MTFHHSLSLSDLGDGRCILRHLLGLEEISGEGGTDKDVDPILRLEAGSHLLVGHFVRNSGRSGIGIIGKELLGSFDGKGHGVIIIHMLHIIVTQRDITDGIFQFAILILGLLLFLLLFLLLVLGFLVLLFLFLLFVAVTLILLFVLLLIFLLILLGILLRLLILCQDVVSKLVTHIHHLLGTTRRTLVRNHPTLDLVVRFRQATIRADHKCFNVFVNRLLQDCIGMMSIDHCPIGFITVRSLCSQFSSKEFIDFSRITVQTQCQFRNVDNDSLTPIPTSFQFTNNFWHFVSVFGIVYWGCPTNINDLTFRHCDRVVLLLLFLVDNHLVSSSIYIVETKMESVEGEVIG
mmetsp:Transcript_24421/g.41663  ORF Transcript_24421/g.41663 Transcript_24421/m.41663 type:complete len:349 (+) Transcript_24421:386-1432(+)